MLLWQQPQCGGVHIQRSRLIARVMAVALGDCLTLILTEEGVMYGVGRNENGVLGCGDYEEHQTPVKIKWNNWQMDAPAIVFAGKDHLACVT